VPEQRQVQADEAYAVFNDWMRRQRWFARLMLGQIGESIDVPEAQLRAVVDKFPFVAFRPAPVSLGTKRSNFREVTPDDHRD
jgi:hypothetical protein